MHNFDGGRTRGPGRWGIMGLYSGGEGGYCKADSDGGIGDGVTECRNAVHVT